MRGCVKGLFIGFILLTFSSLLLAQDGLMRKVVDVPHVDPTAITVDGLMNETEWQNGGQANLVTESGYEIYANYYGRELSEPDYDAYYARLLWSVDTLFLFIHIDEFVNDSTDLFWHGQWTGDQLFVSLSSRLGMDMDTNYTYQGNAFAIPEGPYHFWILGDTITFNCGNPVGIPDAFRCALGDTVEEAVFDAASIARWGVHIDKAGGIWDLEMAIYNPGINAQSAIGFNLGGSTGSQAFYDWSVINWGYGDAYGYYTWQPNVPDDPFAIPATAGASGDPGFDNLRTSKNWAVLYFDPNMATGIGSRDAGPNVASGFLLDQNYPNPFNPKTTIRFKLAEKGSVKLSVFNAAGQLVTRLIDNQRYTAGSYLVSWDASHLASGVYFYELMVNGAKDTKKMVLMK